MFCDVDLLILKSDKARIIVEIEESNIKPTQICGKYLASALSNGYAIMPQKEPIKLEKPLLFLQIVNAKKLPTKTTKKVQVENLGKAIKQITPLKGSLIDDYKLLSFTDAQTFNLEVEKLFKEIEK